MEEKAVGPQIFPQLVYGLVVHRALLYPPPCPDELAVHPVYGEMKPTPESTGTSL